MTYFTKFFLSLLFSMLSVSSLVAQKNSPYHLSKADTWITVGGFVTGFGSQYIVSNRTPFTAQEIQQLDPLSVNSLDRFVTDLYNTDIGRRSYITLGISGGAAALSTVIFPFTSSKGSRWNQVGTLAVLFLENNMITLTGTNIAKGIFKRTRPFAYNPNVPLTAKLQSNARDAFFSGHVSMTAANSFFAAKVFSDYFPESKLKPLIWGVGVALPVFVATQRIRAGKHYPTDTFVGLLFGAACGYLVPHLHKQKNKDLGIHILPIWGQGERGVAFQLKF